MLQNQVRDKVDNSRVLTVYLQTQDFTDTITAINRTNYILKADIVAVGIPTGDTNTTYIIITTLEVLNYNLMKLVLSTIKRASNTYSVILGLVTF